MLLCDGVGDSGCDGVVVVVVMVVVVVLLHFCHCLPIDSTVNIIIVTSRKINAISISKT